MSFFQGFKITECVLDQERCHQNRYKCIHHFASLSIAGENGYNESNFNTEKKVN